MLDIPLKDYFRETRLFDSRLSIAAVIVLLLTLALLARLVYLQVISYRHYATLSQENRIRPWPIPPVRGRILDRNGIVLAENLPVYTLEITPEQVEDMDELLQRLGEFVQLDASDIRNFKKQLRKRPRFESLVLRTRLNDQEAARIAVNRSQLHGVELQARLQRYYPLGGLAVHAIGYVGRIDEQESSGIDRSAYRGTQHIGKLGVEGRYEGLLLGQVGVEKVETNALGRTLRAVERIAPRAGQNLYVNLDAKLQATAEAALEGRRGAVVALDPKTGGVLVFASTPVYDPNPFVNGIDSESYRILLEDPDKPLINRVIDGQYAPGSTIKPFLALGALESPGFDPTATIICRGAFKLPGSRRRFRDWKKYGHGEMDLPNAVEQSCDVYFYTLAAKLGIDYMHEFLTRLGFGTRTGIDLIGESPGLVPSRQWKRARGEAWYPGDTVVTGIGQGALLVTPLQLASAVSALANRGRWFKPRMLRAIEDPKTKTRREVVPELAGNIAVAEQEHWETLVTSMIDVVHGEKGTARRIGWNAPYTIAGKTGTAQVKGVGQNEVYDAEQTPERLRDHALFIAFAPAEDPRIAIAVIVENGGHGSSAAAPIARKVMDQYLLAGNPDKSKTVSKPAHRPPSG
ncbi:MAG: penicillin-binding protein 2 [Acidiferrobacterales bacterium]